MPSHDSASYGSSEAPFFSALCDIAMRLYFACNNFFKLPTLCNTAHAGLSSYVKPGNAEMSVAGCAGMEHASPTVTAVDS